MAKGIRLSLTKRDDVARTFAKWLKLGNGKRGLAIEMTRRKYPMLGISTIYQLYYRVFKPGERLYCKTRRAALVG